MRKENSIYKLWLERVDGYIIALVVNGRFHEMRGEDVSEIPINEAQIEKFEYMRMKK